MEDPSITLDVSILGREYRVACRESEREELLQAVQFVDRRMLVAPIGVRLAHRWPVVRLRKAFAGLMYVIAAFFLWKLIKG